MYILIVITVGLTCTVVQKTELREKLGKYGDQTVQQVTILYNHWSTSNV